MAEEKDATPQATADDPLDYQSPVIEEVVTREKLEREVAYAGVQIPSDLAPN